RSSLVDSMQLSDELIDCSVVGLPGVIENGSRTLHLSHFFSLENRPLGDELHERLQVPVVLENDVNLAALGEQWQGVARGVADVGLVVLGGGIGANGDLLLERIRRELAGWLPYPPRVEISSLGEAAVLTGALAVGLRAALDNVFAQRRPASR